MIASTILPSPIVKRPLTFSPTNANGILALRIRTYSLYRTLRESSMRRGPDRLNPWHGKPPSIMSESGISLLLIFVTSPHTTLALLHERKVSQASALKSFAQIVLNPALSNPRSRPPAPQNKLTAVNIRLFFRAIPSRRASASLHLQRSNSRRRIPMHEKRAHFPSRTLEKPYHRP